MNIDSTTKIYLGGVEQVKIMKNGSVIWEKQQQDTTDYFYIENTYNGTNTVTINTVSSQTVPSQQFFTSTLEYSKDKLNWSTLNLSIGTQHTITLNQGEKVYFRNSNGVFNYYNRSTSTWVSNCFSADEYHSAGGNVNSLGDYTNMDNFTIPTGFLFNLFGIDVNTGDVRLNDISQLRMPATTLANFCYKNLFSNCIGITQIPATLLPATTLAEGCYMWLFQNTGVSTVPSGLLPALTMQSYCYQGLFENCIYLTTVPSNMLPGTTLASQCYRALFYGATSLRNSPDLIAQTTVANCYNSMFYNCSSLNEITTYTNSISGSNALSNWTYGVSATGTFYKYGNANFPSGASGIPSGWTVVTQ